MKIEVYSDGSGTTKNTPGGCGFVMVVDGVKHSEGSFYLDFATNNDCELMAAILGLELVKDFIINLKEPFQGTVTLVSDSQIVLNWASGKNDFKQLDKMDKYEKLMGLMSLLKADTRWVKGHSGEPFQERCDRLANASRLNCKVEELK